MSSLGFVFCTGLGVTVGVEFVGAGVGAGIGAVIIGIGVGTTPRGVVVVCNGVCDPTARGAPVATAAEVAGEAVLLGTKEPSVCARATKRGKINPDKIKKGNNLKICLKFSIKFRISIDIELVELLVVS